MMQRFFDIIFSALALLVLSPILLIVIVILKFTGEGEVFYLQDRVGKGGDTFKLFKFATMLKDSPTIGTGTVTVKDDPRVLPFGKFLRKTKLNEIPQLLNILKGDMSVIGPRPQTPRCFGAFSKPQQEAIIKVRPGLSGIGSIIFSHEEDLLSDEKATVDVYDKIIAPYKGDVERWYVEHQSLFTYFKLIFLTAWVVILDNRNLVWSMFPTLVRPPEILHEGLGYTNE